ncbi:hypothetical protein HLB42_06455 [Deinococcus sp. D7000]|nr:hypothetical protein HLB42_06455 [Deinococcus sp. D7000]
MTAATTELTPAARAYLRRATWGLPRARQQEVWDELEEHLLTRAAQLQACGAAPPEALARALTELGSPARVSAGMTGVYLMPKLILMASAGALALSAALYALAGGSAGNILTLPILTRTSPSTLCASEGSAALQLPVISRRDKLICYKTAVNAVGASPLVSLSTVQAAVGLHGGTAKLLSDNRLEIRMYGTWSRTGIVYKTENESYIPASSLFNALVNLRPHLPATETTLSGYDHPVLRVGDRAIQFGSGPESKLGEGIYNSLSDQVISSLLYQIPPDKAFTFDTYFASTPAATHVVQTPFDAGEVVTLLQQAGKNKFYVDTAEVGAGGTVKLKTAQRKLRFVAKAAQLNLPAADGRTPALLVRVTNIPLNNLKSGIFVPAKTTSDAN